MNRVEFARLVHIGLGRAVLYLQSHGATSYQDVILHHCLQASAYDPQSEGPRGAYLYDLITSTSEEDFYRDRVLAALATRSSEGSWDATWHFDLARVFAHHGDEYARAVMYTRFLQNVTAESATGAEALIALDGIDGFLYVANQLGEVLLSEPEAWGDTQYLFQVLANRYGEGQTLALLDAARLHNPRLEAFMQARNGRHARKGSFVGRTKAVVGLPYSEIRNRILGNRGRLSFRTLATWGTRASESDFEQTAEDLIRESDPARLVSYLWIFAERSFPLDPQPLVHLVFGDDDKLAWFAARALAKVNHPSVREAAFRLLEQTDRQREGVYLLCGCFQDGDRVVLGNILRRNLDDESLHSMGFDIRDLFKRHSSADNIPILLLLYEKGPCSMCRKVYVEMLLELDALPAWISAECRYDANLDIRQLVQ